jgi:hypothetical protein
MAKLIYVDTGADGGTYDGQTLDTAYRSLFDAEAAEDADITGLGAYTFRCHATTGAADTTAVTFVGWTTTAADYIVIEGATGHRAKASGWDANIYRLSTVDTIALLLNEQYVRVDGLQIENTGITTNKAALSFTTVSAGGSDLRATNCRVRTGMNDGVTNATAAINCSDGDATHTVVNCIVEGISTGSGIGNGIYIACDGDAGTSRITNCTVYNCRRAIMDGTGSKINVYNTVSFNNEDDFYGTFNVIDHCASDDNDGTNNVAESGGGASWPDDFEGAATGDFRLKSTSNLVGAGLDDPLANGLGSPDIDGTTRSDWDVGAFEYPTVGQSTAPLSAAYYARLRG